MRAGTGGDEAALFAADLFRMYQRYAALRGWRFELLDLSETGIGGFKEATASITGRDVFARLKYESGVHRVQRVPETEASGPHPYLGRDRRGIAGSRGGRCRDRRQGSAHRRVPRQRPRRAVGQHDRQRGADHASADRAGRDPAGREIAAQEQGAGAEGAARPALRDGAAGARRARAADRKSQVGSGDRSERIRTYNFPQGRVTDHRINLTLYKIDKIMSGEALDEIIDALTAADRAAKLATVEG